MRPLSIIRNGPLFEGVEEKTVARICAALTEKSWAKGHQISGPADSLESFHLLLEGRVKIVRSNSHDGRELTVWLLGPGDGFDVVSLLDGRPHGVTAWALDPVRTLCSPLALWRQSLQDSRTLRLAVHRHIGGKLREVTELAGDLALHDTSTRLAHLLLRHFEAGAKGGNLLHDLPQRELASLIGSVRIVVSRVLADMRRRGIVQLHGGAVQAVDLKRLVALAEADLARRGPIEPREARRGRG